MKSVIFESRIGWIRSWSGMLLSTMELTLLICQLQVCGRPTLSCITCKIANPSYSYIATDNPLIQATCIVIHNLCGRKVFHLLQISKNELHTQYKHRIGPCLGTILVTALWGGVVHSFSRYSSAPHFPQRPIHCIQVDGYRVKRDWSSMRRTQDLPRSRHDITTPTTFAQFKLS